MKHVLVNVLYYFAITLLLIFASYEAYKNDKKLIALLSAFVAAITAYHGINNLRKPV